MHLGGAITQPEKITLEAARRVAAQWVENEARTLIEYGLSRYYGGDPVARQCALWSMSLGSLTRGDLRLAQGLYTIVAAWPVFAAEILRDKARSENQTVVPTEVFERAYEDLKATLMGCGMQPLKANLGCTEPFVLMSGGPAVFALAAARIADGPAREALINVARMGCQSGALRDFERQIAIRCFGTIRYFFFGGDRPAANPEKPWCRVFLWLENYCKTGELPDLSAPVPDPDSAPVASKPQGQSQGQPQPSSIPDAQGKLKGLLFLAGGGAALYLGLRAMKVI